LKTYHDLFIKNIDIFALALNENKTRRGRQSNEERGGYGVNKLRSLILDLAIKGCISEQFVSDEPSHQLIQRILVKKSEVLLRQKIKSDFNVASKRVDMPFDLPRSWVWATLGDIGWTQTGSTPPKNDPSMFGSEIPFIKPADIYKNHVNYSNEGLSIEGAKTSSRIAKAGSLLMVCIGTIGKCNLIERDCSFNQQINSLTPCLMNPDYLLLALRSNYFQKSAWAKSSSTTIPILNKGKWEKILIPIPPLDEQQRIVDRVNELMTLFDILDVKNLDLFDTHNSLVNEVLANLNKKRNSFEFEKSWGIVVANFDTLFTTLNSVGSLRRTLLSLAVTGKLVPQMKSEDSAQNLFSNIQAHKYRFSPKGRKTPNQTQALIMNRDELPDGWVVYKFGDLVINRDSERVPVSAEARQAMSGEFDYYGASGVIDKVNDYLFDEPLLLIGEDGANLINRSTPIAFMAHGKYWVNNHAHVLGGINVDFLRYLELYINSIDLRPYITGTAQPKMNQAKMNSIEVWVPPAAEQLRILAKLEELLDFCDRLEQKINQLNVMKRKIADVLVEQALA